MTHDSVRKNHFERLNNYRHSAEYAEYARTIGADIPQGELPSLIGNKWEIDAETYREFLEMLPPLGWRGETFYMSEFTFSDISTKYSKEGDKYYCEFARYPEKKREPVWTPWGVADTVTEIAPGIISYSTPSHGGIWLSDARVASMPKPLRDFVPFGGPQKGPGRWFEEDCDWSIVAVAFPQFFKPEDIDAALKTLQHYKPKLYAEVVAMRSEGRGA
jgi:hypothetical protein